MSRSDGSKVAIMILNYNGLHWLANCLRSVLKSSYSDFSVYLIDNGSTDGSVEFVRRTFPTVKLIANPSNLGFPKAYNQAISEITCEYIVLLNSDTQVLDEDWIDYLAKRVEEDPSVAAVACKMVSMQKPQILASVGGMGIPFWRGFVDIGRGEPDTGQYSSSFTPFAFCGGASLIRRSAFLSVGGLDERFFLYSEDVDISWRWRLIGRTIAFAPDAIVAHFFSASFGGVEVNPVKLFYCHRDLLRSIIKNCGSSLKWALANYFLFTVLILFGFSVFEPRKAVSVLKGLLWNLRFLRNTLAERNRVQSYRLTDDRNLLKIMYPKVTRFKQADHAQLRRVLDTLFARDHST